MQVGHIQLVGHLRQHGRLLQVATRDLRRHAKGVTWRDRSRVCVNHSLKLLQQCGFFLN